MRLAILLEIVFFAQSITAQTNVWQQLWQHVSLNSPERPIQTIKLAEFQRAATVKLLKSRERLDAWQSCQLDVHPENDWLQELQFETISLSSSNQVILVEVGPSSCARGGNAANGAMWLVRFDENKPTVLATPHDDFNGFVYSVQKTSSHGYRDVVLGWSMGSAETPLSYLRFDGKSYHAISSAKIIIEEGRNPKLVP